MYLQKCLTFGVHIMPGTSSVFDISVSCMSHLICFAAEDSRLNNTVVNMDNYMTMLKNS